MLRNNMLSNGVFLPTPTPYIEHGVFSTQIQKMFGEIQEKNVQFFVWNSIFVSVFKKMFMFIISVTL